MTSREAAHKIFVEVLCNPSDDVKVRALNKLFKELFLDVSLSLTDKCIPVWVARSDEDILLARQFFEDIVTEFSEEELEIFIDNKHEYMLVNAYEYIFNIHKRHNETLTWMREIEEANSNGSGKS